jgi:integrase/recombinase XerD
MAGPLFRSVLAPRLEAFLRTRSVGSRGQHTRKILCYLDQFLTRELKPGQTISREVAERWMASMKDLSPGTRSGRIAVLRQFCRYLSYFNRATFIVPRSCTPRRTRPAPHIYTRGEVREIMAGAKRVGPPGTLRPAVVSTLIGLLYATGLRIGEALNLTLGEVDLERRLLLVQKGKFNKSRYVPISPSTACQLARYLHQRRRAGWSTASTAPLFVNLSGAKYAHPTFTSVFLQILRKSGLRGPKGQRGPRVHDLRHTFAVGRLLSWYKEGVDLGAKLPLLSTYLGHTGITGTQVYLHATAQLLGRVSKRFHTFFTGTYD